MKLFKLTVDGDKLKLVITVSSKTTKEVIWVDAMMNSVNINIAYRYIYIPTYRGVNKVEEFDSADSADIADCARCSVCCITPHILAL